jgi:uncharacterized protein (DUF983 family)
MDSGGLPIAAATGDRMMSGDRISAGKVLLRGWRGRCPACGKGHIFRAFLKVADHCDACGEELYHHRADDFPAYCVIFAVGHIIVPLVLVVETTWMPPLWLHAAIWLPAVLALSIGLLQPFKGGIVALQWLMGMHGFEAAKKARDLNGGVTLLPASP